MGDKSFSNYSPEQLIVRIERSKRHREASLAIVKECLCSGIEILEPACWNVSSVNHGEALLVLITWQRTEKVKRSEKVTQKKTTTTTQVRCLL